MSRVRLPMAHPRVLSVGQCGPDQGRIAHHLRRRFQAEVRSASTAEQARVLLESQACDLVLVNRVFDLDGTSGTDFIRELKADQNLRAVPVMLVSNYAAAQTEAVALGALPGFGKAELDAPQTQERLSQILRPPAAATP